MQAQHNSALELDAQARQAALQRLALAPTLSDPVHVDLLIAYGQNVYAAKEIDAVIPMIQAARSAQIRSSPADICLLITLGQLQFRQDHTAQAGSSPTQAYRVSLTSALSEQHIRAAAALSTVLRSAGGS